MRKDGYRYFIVSWEGDNLDGKFGRLPVRVVDRVSSRICAI